MSRIDNLESKLNNILDLPQDVVFDLPRITLVGNVKLSIENHKGIIEYLPAMIRIALNVGEIEITGSELIVVTINRDEICLGGLISSLRFYG